jgi:hypothetical protein
MPTCLKCDKKFSNRVLINGQIKNVCNRKFCLECSPFGFHNTRDITVYIEKENSRVCVECNIEKNKIEFGFRHNRINKTHAVCKKCTTILKIKKQRENKQKCVDYLGGECIVCKYKKSINSLHFHHLDPSIKEFTIGETHSRSFETIIKELDKCILVCANCHGEIHAGLHTDILKT